jgi:hypothetical protein
MTMIQICTSGDGNASLLLEENFLQFLRRPGRRSGESRPQAGLRPMPEPAIKGAANFPAKKARCNMPEKGTGATGTCNFRRESGKAEKEFRRIIQSELETFGANPSPSGLYLVHINLT